MLLCELWKKNPAHRGHLGQWNLFEPLEISNYLFSLARVVGGKGWSRVNMMHFALCFEEREGTQANMWVLGIWDWSGRGTCGCLSGELVNLHACFLRFFANAVLGRGSGHNHALPALQNSQALSASSETIVFTQYLRRVWVAYDLILKNWSPLEIVMGTFSNQIVKLTETLIFYSMTVIVNRLCYTSPDDL